MNAFSHVPPGFRFHPTDEELVDYYLRKKITCRRIDLDVIKEIDLYKIEPWDLQELCRLGTEDQSDWYFFSHKDKKYPTGTRTNRATTAGFWKATGRDKAIYLKHGLIGMRKTLVFYQGRAPNGQKSDWIMHEYRLETDDVNMTTQEEGWVVCRVFKKRIATTPKMSEHESPIWYDDQVPFMPDFDSPNQISHSKLTYHNHHHLYSCKKELDFPYQIPHKQFLQLPLLESPKALLQTASPMTSNSLPLPHQISTFQSSSLTQEDHIQSHEQNMNSIYGNNSDQTLDWRVLDKFVASQLSQDDLSKEHDFSNEGNMILPSEHTNLQLNMSEMAPKTGPTSNSSCQLNDMWK